MNKKGFLISFDALLALMIFFIMFAMSTAFLSEVKFEAKNSVLLKERAMDAITILEKNDYLKQATEENDPKAIRRFLNRLPNSFCAQISVFGENDFSSPQMTVLRQDCEKTGSDLATINRSFVVKTGYDAEFFTARITAWQKVSQ